MGLSAATRFLRPTRQRSETFHPSSVPMIADTCLGCHGVQGQRQFAIDRHAATGACETIDREMVNAVPYPPGDPVSRLAKYGALARDGVSCASCHRMVVGKADADKHQHEPQNKCVEERQAALNPGLTGFAKTFTGCLLGRGRPTSSMVNSTIPRRRACTRPSGATRSIVRRFQAPRCAARVTRCICRCCIAACKIGHFYEQTTYPEWAFSDYRTGATPDGALPLGAGRQGEVLPGLPHAQQGRGRQSLPKQDCRDPGIHQISAGRAHARSRRTSICPSAPASPPTRWSGLTSSC